MTEPRPDDYLLATAQDLLAAAEAAGGKAWVADHFPEGTVIRPADSTHSLLHLHADGNRAAGTPCLSKPVGAYIAKVGPTTGIAIAKWLESVGEFLAACRETHGNLPHQAIYNSRHALAVAGAITETEAADHV